MAADPAAELWARALLVELDRQEDHDHLGRLLDLHANLAAAVTAGTIPPRGQARLGHDLCREELLEAASVVLEDLFDRAEDRCLRRRQVLRSKSDLARCLRALGGENRARELEGEIATTRPPYLIAVLAAVVARPTATCGWRQRASVRSIADPRERRA